MMNPKLEALKDMRAALEKVNDSLCDIGAVLSYSDQRQTARAKAYKPRWLYDCGHCKMFSCGPECACHPEVFKLKPGPSAWFAVKIGTHPKTLAEVRPVAGHPWPEMQRLDHRPMPPLGAKVEFREYSCSAWTEGIVDRILEYEGLALSHV